MLFKQASQDKVRLSLATVYNTLRQFSEGGLLREIAVYGSTTWYDTKTGSHCHFYVEDTGQLIDIPGSFSSSLPPLSVPDGFDLAGVDMIARLRSRPGVEPAGGATLLKQQCVEPASCEISSRGDRVAPPDPRLGAKGSVRSS
jgi:hypothetical protein